MRTAALGTCALLLAAPGWGADSTVSRYVEEVLRILDQYSQELQKQTGANEKAYQEHAALAARAKREELDGTLQFERNRRSEQLSADFTEMRKPVSMWKEYLLEYGHVDFSAYQSLLTFESEIAITHLASLESLEIEKAKVEALSKTLKGLIKKQSLVDQAKQLGAFAQETGKEFGRLICDGAKKDLEEKEASKKQVDAEVAALEAKPQSPETKVELDERKAAAARLADEIKALQGLRARRTCNE